MGLLRNAIVVAVNGQRRDLLPQIVALVKHTDASVREMAEWGEMRLSRDGEP